MWRVRAKSLTIAGLSRGGSSRKKQSSCQRDDTFEEHATNALSQPLKGVTEPRLEPDGEEGRGGMLVKDGAEQAMDSCIWHIHLRN
jgi:hypothetical protein